MLYNWAGDEKEMKGFDVGFVDEEEAKKESLKAARQMFPKVEIPDKN